MMEHRKVVKRTLEKPSKSKEPANISTLELSIPSPEESNRSLLIHDDQYDIFSDNSADAQEFQDSDIPEDKMNIINNPNYFKQLSLSFYGTARPSRKPRDSQYESNSVLKTEGSKPDASNSPKNYKEYYVGLKRPSLLKKVDRSSFQLNFSSFTQNMQKPQRSLTSSKIAVNSSTKPRPIERNDSNEYINLSRIEPKPYRINTKPNTNTTKSSVTNLYPQLANGINSSTVQSSVAPRKGSFFNGENIGPLSKDIRRPSANKNSVYTKQKPTIQDYLLSEPSSSALKLTVSKSSNIVPRKLKMYAVDNLCMFNVRNSVGLESKLSANRSSSREKIPTRPTLTKKGQDSMSKRGIVTFKNQMVKKNAYYGC